MLEKNYGRIISISSFVGQKGNLAQTNYAASKAGLIGFSKSLALEVARNNVTVNTINPGFIATEMVLKIREDVQQKLIAQVPLNRFGTPEEVAKAVLFLAADGDYITGQQINVNGGIYM
jgi:NAD(P)-dependent dehydrogenase (short-subunit alcohol dehydrogenase family)